jgi:PIN domain nuclease of toxin-antitoxin system
MKRAAIDTHALVFYLSAPRKLGRGAARWLRDAEAGRAEVVVPAAVTIELALLRDRGRRVVGPAEVEALLTVQPRFSLCPLDLRQALEFTLLGAVPELFDRLIVAAARSQGVPLITRDAVIADSGLITTIWG